MQTAAIKKENQKNEMKEVSIKYSEETRKLIEKGRIEESLNKMKEWIDFVDDKKLKSRFHNQIIGIKSRYSFYKSNIFKGTIKIDEDQIINKIVEATLSLIELFENEFGENENIEKEANCDSLKVELITSHNFENFSDNDLENFLGKLRTILKVNPSEVVFINKKPGSVKITLETTPEIASKIQALFKIELLKEIIDYKVKNKAWNRFIKDISEVRPDLSKSDFSNMFFDKAAAKEALEIIEPLERVDLHDDEFRKIIIKELRASGINFHRAKLNSSNFAKAILVGANFRETDLRKANFEKAILFGADLSNSNLKGVNFRNATLSLCDMRYIIADYYNLNEANLDFALFNLSQKDSLIENDIDISNLVFIDDNSVFSESLIFN